MLLSEFQLKARLHIPFTHAFLLCVAFWMYLHYVYGNQHKYFPNATQGGKYVSKLDVALIRPSVKAMLQLLLEDTDSNGLVRPLSHINFIDVTDANDE